MLVAFDDCCLWGYVVVDESYARLPAAYELGRGPLPGCSDSELLAMALAGECRGWTRETELVKNWRERRHLFQSVPERSRFNRRRRALAQAINAIRQATLAALDVAQDRQCTIDSLPVSVLQFHLVPSATGADGWRVAGADFGKVLAKRQTVFGYKLHLLITLGGGVRDFASAGASASDVTVAAEPLRDHADLTVFGDKGYISAPLAQELWASHAVALLTVPPRNQRRQLPVAATRLLNASGRSSRPSTTS
jgi:hypothetical protein